MKEPRDLVTRTRRFAHLIVSCAEEADEYVFDVISEQRDRLNPGLNHEEMRTLVYRSLCDRLATRQEAVPVKFDAHQITPVISRFKNLPIVNRMAFALMVIEEFSSDAAAHILRMPDTTLEEKIHQSRQLLFEE